MFGNILHRHSISQTTEIYTHVTTEGFDQTKSPLDNFDVSTKSISFGEITRHKALDTRRIMTLKISNMSTLFPQMILSTTTNQSLRDRFKIENQNAAIASRIIRDALEESVIKEDDPENKSRKYASYLPFWA
jgi:hypothetical protein